jgi:hypothetical protein
MADGFFTLSEGQYLIVTNTPAANIRDWLRVLGANPVAVFRIQGGAIWGGQPGLGEWLQNAAPFF